MTVIGTPGLRSGPGMAAYDRTTAVVSQDTSLTNQPTIIVDTTTAPVTLSLPSFPSNGQSYEIKRVGLNNLTIDAGINEVDGVTQYVISKKFHSVVLVWDSNYMTWWIL